MRLSNDRFKSTVHRVFNRSTVDRYSMPFFFGFNFNEKCGVLPSCVDDEHPAKYEPISCGDWCQLRFQRKSSRTLPFGHVLTQAYRNGPGSGEEGRVWLLTVNQTLDF